MQKKSLAPTASELAQLAASAALANPNPEALTALARQRWLDGVKPYIENIIKKTRARESGCLEWVGGKEGDGYGMTYMFKKQWRAPRLFYFLWKGDPSGMQVCHTCDNPCCVNPAHLFLGTAKENVRDCVSKGRFTGPRGESNGWAKLTAEQVSKIRSEYVPRSAANNMNRLAERYGVTASTICVIVNRKHWKHI